MNFFKNKKGFTLVELVVVIAILGILAGIAIPRFMDATASARGAKVVADMRTVESAVSMYYAKVGTYPANIDALVPKYLAAVPVPPTGKMIVEGSETYGAGADVPGATYALKGATNATNGEVEVICGTGTTGKTISDILSRS